MEPESSMLRAQSDIQRVAAPTDRRPDFIAEALSPRFRIGLLILTLLAEVSLVVGVVNAAVRPGFLFEHDLYGVLLASTTLVATFVVFLVFGALAGNNPRLTTPERLTWYALFALLGPVMIPCYWFMHVWSVPYQPAD